MNPLYERATVADVLKAMVNLAALLPFFPQDAYALKLLSEHCHDFIGTREQLDWFARKAGGSLIAYNGVPELRALYCTKYNPHDGVMPIVDCPGFEEDRLEADFRRREMEENDKRLEAYQREKLLAPPEESEPFLLPEAKALPPAPELPAELPLVPADQVAEVARCAWCAEGNPRVRSSVSGALIHTRTEVGRVVCKNRSPYPEPVAFVPDSQDAERDRLAESAGGISQRSTEGASA